MKRWALLVCVVFGAALHGAEPATWQRLADIPAQLRFRLSSFEGGEYQPRLAQSKDMRHLGKHILQADLAARPLDAVTLTTSISLRQNIIGNDVSFEEFSAMYAAGHYRVGYRYFRLGLGEGSELFTRNVLHPYHREPVLETYDFYGAEAGAKLGGYALLTRAGGNDYNAGLAQLGVRRESAAGHVELSVLGTGHDNRSYSAMYALVQEARLRLGAFSLYDAVMVRHYPDFDDGEAETWHSGIVEGGWLPCPAFEFLTNYCWEHFASHTWRVNTLGTWTPGRVSVALGWEYYHREAFCDRAYTLLAMYHLQEGWQLGLNAAHSHPLVGEDAYRLGVQTTLDISL